jgi:DNA repair protein RadC
MELREEFYILLLNRANYLLGWYQISQGGLSGTVCDPRLIFSVALKCLACSIIMSHNSSLRKYTASAADIQLTKNIVDGGITT